jgi:hypothetical protein
MWPLLVGMLAAVSKCSGMFCLTAATADACCVLLLIPAAFCLFAVLPTGDQSGQ